MYNTPYYYYEIFDYGIVRFGGQEDTDQIYTIRCIIIFVFSQYILSRTGF